MARSTSKWKQVEGVIKGLIVSGDWKPGEQLPTYDELERRFQVSRITLQQVIRHLKQDGFITSLVRQGLFVSKQPPHLNRVGIAILRDEKDVRYWHEMVLCARAAAEAQGKELVVYRNLEVSEEALARFQYDVENQLLSGVVFPFPVAADTPGNCAFEQSALPKAVASSSFAKEASIVFRLDDRQLVVRSLDYLQEKGCQKIAVFSNIGLRLVSILDAEVKSRGLEIPDERRFAVALNNRELAGKIAQLLLSLPKSEQPDGIFISDDNLTSSVIKGLVSTHLRLPDDLPVVSHCNWSVGVQDRLPVTGIGFDLKTMLANIIKAFDAYHQCGSLPKTLKQAALFEHELPRDLSSDREDYPQ